MLTTTLDGLWALQVLTGIEVLAPELGLRPHLPSIENRQTVLTHPVAQELREAGVIGSDGTVDATVLEWLTVLSRRDVAVLIYVQTPDRDSPAEPERILLARFAQWWVSLERCGTRIRLSGAGTAGSEDSAALLISTQIERLCGHLQPATLKPASIDVAEFLCTVTDSASLRRYLIDRKFDDEQVAVLTMAASPGSAQATVVAIQSGTGGGPARSHIEPASVTIIDTPQGRLMTEQIQYGGKNWMIIGPGSPLNIATSVLTLMRNLPAQQYWYSHRKVV